MKLKTLMMVAPVAVVMATAVHAQSDSNLNSPKNTGPTKVWTTKEPGGATTTTVQEAPPMKEPAGAPSTTTVQTTTTTTSPWNMNERFTYAHEGELFRGGEFSFDAFGHYSTTTRESFEDFFHEDIKGGTFGGGVGLNYFFSKYIGVSTDVEMGDNGKQFIDSAAANLVLRLPFDVVHLAPYIFGGGGGQFDPEAQWMADAGIGIDFRINHFTGIFTDVRFVWPENTADYGLFRAGMRFSF